MLSQSDESTAIHVQPVLAAAYQRTRLKANAVLLRYGHIIPVAAVLICLLISTTICIQREVQYIREAKQENTTTTTPTPTSTPTSTTTTTTTAVPTMIYTSVPSSLDSSAALRKKSSDRESVT
ncbi:hypothetical protein ABL78_7985 [Leptomonas seymouri]|uniref:Uncharacterized protein n=1 Tax=Leptomonas seymouri TaxID=5684 RepID=A0A0N1IGJ7_LEPSE|nr:hypothetical protein ABL78_7985 [Leptomonas seymouri]|eukprot:KPI82995.1 hypothetical protein ABL78_7985 [Leptomonas seymouri]